jgi:hypothetical protein
MIIQPKTTGTIVSLKLISGEEIVGRFESEDFNTFKISKPCLAAMTQNGPTLAPFMFTMSPLDEADANHVIEINKNTVVTSVVTYKPFADAYTNATSSIKPASSLVL